MVSSRKFRLLIIWLLLGLGVFSLIKSFQASAAQREYSKCQQDWNTFLLKSISMGRSANGEAQAAMDDLVNAIAESKSQAESQAALARYKAAREAQKKTAVENPLPAPPKQVCGEL